MNIQLSNTNSKGQIVLPKKYREQLKINQNVPLQITLRDDSIIIKPVTHVSTNNIKNLALIDLLKKTQGTWQGEQFTGNTELELKATEDNKAAW